MNSISKIKNRITALLQKEIERSTAEIQELLHKQHDNMASYGIGGPYNRYEKAIARRETHIKELEALQKVQGCAVILEPCSNCEYCDGYRRAGNNWTSFSCQHPDQRYIHDYFIQKGIRKMPGFLGLGAVYSDIVPLKTSPAWCPKKR